MASRKSTTPAARFSENRPHATAVWIVSVPGCVPRVFADFEPAFNNLLRMKYVPGVRLTLDFDLDDEGLMSAAGYSVPRSDAEIRAELAEIREVARA